MLTPFYYDDASSLMNLSNSPCSIATVGNQQQQQYTGIMSVPNNLPFMTQGSINAKGAFQSYDRKINSNKVSNRQVNMPFNTQMIQILEDRKGEE